MKKNSFKVFLLLFITNWISHFLYFKRFGLYEDDYGSLIPKSIPETNRILDLVIFRMTNWIQGHPLAFIPNLFSYISDCFGGNIYFLYLIAFIIVLINSFLMYKVLKKVFPDSELFAISGALIFTLFPPDTTKLYLLHAYVLQFSLMFFLIATILYLSNHKKLCYLVLLGSLFSYESAFVIFLGVPFLKGSWDKKFRKNIIKNFLIICLLAILVLIYRIIKGESRAAEATGEGLYTLYKIFTAMLIGPLMNLFLFLRAPVVTVIYWFNDNSVWWYYDYIFYFLGFCFLLYLWYFYRVRPDYNYIKKQNQIKLETGTDVISDSQEESRDTLQYFKKVFRILIAGIVLLMLAYAVSFTHYPPTEIIGRRTSVHLAATFGASIIFACVCVSIFYLAEKYKIKNTAVIFVSLYLTLLVGYNSYTQKEFVESWTFQKSYWKKIIELCPDLKEGTVILSQAGTRNFFVTRYIWSVNLVPDEVMLKTFFLFPPEWKNPPTTYSSVWGWEKRVEEVKGKFQIKRPPYEPLILQDSNVILIDADKNNNFFRIDSSVTINGKTLHLKPKGKPTINAFKTTKLYDIMIREEE